MGGRISPNVMLGAETRSKKPRTRHTTDEPPRFRVGTPRYPCVYLDDGLQGRLADIHCRRSCPIRDSTLPRVVGICSRNRVKTLCARLFLVPTRLCADASRGRCGRRRSGRRPAAAAWLNVMASWLTSAFGPLTPL